MRGSFSFLTAIGFFLLLQFFDNFVQFVEARGPELAVPFDPCRLFLQPARAQPAGPHTPDLLGGDEPACSRTLTCSFMPVRVMGNFSARSRGIEVWFGNERMFPAKFR